MVAEIQNYVKSLNFGYRKVLKEKTITYLNAYAQFVDAHTVKVSFSLIMSTQYSKTDPCCLLVATLQSIEHKHVTY
jgi:pyruvate/2-oxoglutarate dehydrogenase complex dihydrolipoamide dehydrogenase (E3) component